MDYAVAIKNVSTSYPRSNDVALRDVSLDIAYGSITLITGPNGAGKTTLLELILGFLRPIKGKIFVLGKEMPKNAISVRRRCSYVMQNFMKPPNTPYTALNVVLMGLAPYKGPFGKLNVNEEKFLNELSKLLGVKNLLGKPFGTLSGGQQQRIMLLRALIRKPQLLLLDEPFSSIDRESREDFSRLIYDIRKRYKCTIIVVSHYTDPLIGYVDRTVVLRDGRVVNE